jgi:acetyl esterase/lipase
MMGVGMVDTYPRFDSELAAFLAANPDVSRESLRAEDIPDLRAAFISDKGESLAARNTLDIAELTVTADDGTPLAFTVMKKKGSRSPRAAVYHIHSGGMIAGDRFIGLDLMADWVETFDVVCGSLEYRLAPEHPDPIPVTDCYSGLVSFAEVAAEYGVSDNSLIITGMSAGGGLAAGVALMARDRGGPNLRAQLLMCPMLDETNDTPSSHQYSSLGLWDRESNDVGWNALLGSRRHTPDVSVYASPAKEKDLTGLPPTFIDVGSEEVFRSECQTYAARLADAGVSVEFHQWAGAFHGFDLSHPTAKISQQAISARTQWLERVLDNHLSG